MPADDPPTFLPAAVPAPRAGRSPIARMRRLFARAPLRADAKRPRPPAAGLYVDAENLPGDVQARRLIARILDDWPSDRPHVRTLSVYVPADKTALWKAWCTDRLSGALVRVRGVQRFRRETSKNSAVPGLAATASAHQRRRPTPLSSGSHRAKPRAAIPADARCAARRPSPTPREGHGDPRPELEARRTHRRQLARHPARLHAAPARRTVGGRHHRQGPHRSAAADLDREAGDRQARPVAYRGRNEVGRRPGLPSRQPRRRGAGRRPAQRRRAPSPAYMSRPTAVSSSARRGCSSSARRKRAGGSQSSRQNASIRPIDSRSIAE